jgi:formylglycine-generating enzyme required for sulfatase activity
MIDGLSRQGVCYTPIHETRPLPISAFAHALRTFQSGQLTQDELSWELDRQLAIEKASPVALLEILKVQQVAEPLPNDAHEAILKHIADWPRDPTIVTGLTREQRIERTPCAGVGDILQGRFSLVALIGEGGMSRVFKAIDLRRVEAGAADPYIAVKVLTEPFNEYFGSIVALQREAHKLQSLSHPNIVRVIDCDRDGQTVFMTMEYLAGESLQKKLRTAGTSGFESSAALSLVIAVGGALEYAHRNHIVHGDLKPGNVIVTDQGAIKVIDFGMARFIARPEGGAPADPSSHAAPKAVTPRYASPEMVAGHDPEPADDVYALACMAYEALGRRHPFGRQSDPSGRDPHSQPPRPPGMRRHQYMALVRALAFDRKKRTSSIRQFLDELLATRRNALMKRWGWFAALAIAMMIIVIFWMRSPAEDLKPRAPPGTTVFTPGSVIRDCPTCPSMTVLPAGRFKQGGSDGVGVSPFERPQHIVVIGRVLAVGTDEVTVGEFRNFITATHRDVAGCNIYDGRWQYQPAANWEAPGFVQTEMHPVTCVSWDDAAAYVKWLSGKAGHMYRLPSASEWEYAARAGTELAQPWGANAAVACAEANVADQSAAQRFPGWTVFACSDRYVYTAPVGSFKANAFGLNDLLGNVFEWVEDCWYDDYIGAPIDGSARFTDACREHEMRGGSWFSSPQYVNASYRNRFAHDYRSSSIGFRVVRDISN